MADQINFINFGSIRFDLTNEATQAATEANLTIGALFANLKAMETEGVLDEWLTDDGTMIEAALVDEVVRRRDEYRSREKASASPVSVPSIDEMRRALGQVINLLGSNEELKRVQQTLWNALEQAGRISLPEAVLRGLAVSIKKHVDLVGKSHLNGRLADLINMLKERGIHAREIHRAVRRRIEALFQEEGLDKAMSAVSKVKGILQLSLTLPLSECLEHWCRTGEVIGERVPRVRRIELREVDHRVRNLGNNTVLGAGQIWQSQQKEAQGPEVLSGLIFVPGNFKNGEFVHFSAPGADGGRDVCLDKTNIKKPEIGVPHDVQVIRRAGDGQTYGIILGPTATAVRGQQVA